MRKDAKESTYKEVFQEAKGKSTRECDNDKDVDRESYETELRRPAGKERGDEAEAQ